MITRPMVADDVDYVIDLGIEMHEESRYSRFKLDIYKCKILFYEIVDNPELYFGWVAEHDGKIQGFMAGYISEFYFGNEKIAQDLSLFVRKDRRGCMAAVNLIKKYEDWARKNGADEIQLGVSTGINEDRTSKLYEKFGFKASGTIFKKEA